MQRPISDPVAITFSRAFYRELGSSLQVDTAVTAGRRAVFSDHRGSPEWATPVLFMRTPTGELYPKEDLWDLPPKKRRARWLVAALFAVLLTGGSGLALREWWVERLVTEGGALLENRRNAEAHERYQDALRLKPGSAEILSNLAAAEEALGHPQEAESHYREAVREQPPSGEHLFNLGQFLNKRGNCREAYGFLLRAVEQDPQRALAHAELARAAERLGMLGRARLHLETALKLDPDPPVFYRLLGELELDSGNPHAATPRLAEALRRYPLADPQGRLETFWLLTLAYDRLGDGSSACAQIQEIRRLDRPGVTHWAQAAEEMAVRRRCPKT